MHVIQLNIYCHIKTGAGRSANNIAYNTIHITSYKKELYKMCISMLHGYHKGQPTVTLHKKKTEDIGSGQVGEGAEEAEKVFKIQPAA